MDEKSISNMMFTQPHRKVNSPSEKGSKNSNKNARLPSNQIVRGPNFQFQAETIISINYYIIEYIIIEYSCYYII